MPDRAEGAKLFFRNLSSPSDTIEIMGIAKYPFFGEKQAQIQVCYGVHPLMKERIISLITFLQSKRGELKKSRFKIWLRAFLLIQFSIIFSIYFTHDIAAGYFTWRKVAQIILLFIPVGFLMSKLVPMKADPNLGAVTLSLDKIYLFLIWFLVIFKLLASYYYHADTVADIIMALILGIMAGRLGGIGIRVRKLKIQHHLLEN
ncbi:MAG: hypothetical protein GY755_02905 [Chloroflexi bacterium]|nr:hypothetical protein [Chloroflexota bacterium]